MPKLQKKEEDNNLLKLRLKKNNTSLRTSIPSDFVKEKNLRDEDILFIPKDQIKIGRLKMEIVEWLII